MTTPTSGAALCATCGVPLDPNAHAVCEVCRGARYCMACAHEHYCTGECRARGCVRGLCARAVQGDVMSSAFGLPGPR